MADTIIGAHDGTFKTDGSISMRETQEFLALREGLSASSFESPGLEGSISIQKLYDASNAGEIVLAGNAAYPSSNYSLGGLRGANYTNNTPPVIDLLGPSEYFVNTQINDIRPDSFSSSLTVDTEGRIYALRVWVQPYGGSTSRITAFGGPSQESATSGTNNAGSPWGLTATIGTQGAQKSFYYHLNNNSNTITTTGRSLGQSGGYSQSTAESTGLLVPPGWRIDVIKPSYLGGGTAYSKNGPAYFYDSISSTNRFMNSITYNYNLQRGNWYQYMTLLNQQPVGVYRYNYIYEGSIRSWIGRSNYSQGYTFKLTRIPMPTF